ncbi:MAG TPA: heavy metal translocating P-type ATPase [Bacteroidetes bacterium]|nr:heavy metal translocating P-type ATPase [Bacteroidota bacterium]
MFMETVETLQKLLCEHCGEDCIDDSIQSEEKLFCCNGCKAVYELLHEAGMESYYSTDVESPGVSLKEYKFQDYSYLDHPEIATKVLDFSDAKNAIVTFKTPQIHCASCVWLLENISRLNPAISFSQVFFDKREVTIRFDSSRLSLSGLVSLMTKIGYRPDLNLDKVQNPKSESSDRPLYLKIGIAGFAFGNIMLFSLPEYLSGNEGVDSQFLTLFGTLNIILALPVFFYSSLDFFIPALKSIRNRFWSMDIAISLGIIAMFFRSLYEIYAGLSVGYMDSFTMLVFLLLVGRLFQKKTYDQLSFERDYKSYFPLAVTRLSKSGLEESVAATLIDTNDILVIRNGELIPADSTLLDSIASLDYSFVTGEADPIQCSKGQLCYAGGRNLGTSVLFRAERPVSASYLTRLWNHDVFAKHESSSIQSISQRFSRYFSPIILGIATIAALFWLPTDTSLALNAFTAVLIVACPCALALSAPFTLGWITNLLSRNKIYLKNGEVAEKLADINTIVFDKTGTLTSRSTGEVVYMGRELSSDEIAMLHSVLHENTHPHGRAFYAWLKSNFPNKTRFQIKNYKEVIGNGVESICNGRLVRIGTAGWVGVANIDPKVIPHPRLYFSFDDQIPGYVEIRNSLRVGVQELIKNLLIRFKLFVLSGDNSRDKDRLSPLFSEEVLLFNKSPEEKLNMIQKLKTQGYHIAMIGDGLNDAGALKASDVGISISDDTVSFTPASDIIMDATSLTKLNQILDFTKDGVKIIYASFVISILYNIIGLAFAVTGTLSPIICAIIMPISSITIIAFTTLATHLSARRRELW